MNLRQKIQITLLAFLILFAFASYHEGSGSTIWLQWLAIIAIMTYMFIFDIAFTNESSFIFDPDAENWRRKTVRDAFGNMMILQTNKKLPPSLPVHISNGVGYFYDTLLWICQSFR